MKKQSGYSNIALVKYWGKVPGKIQIPTNPSLSFTLSNCRSILEYDYEFGADQFELSLLFEGRHHPDFEKKLNYKIVKRLQERFPFVKNLKLSVNGHNTFPHSAGIASSASSMSAVAKVLAEIYFSEFAEKLSVKEVGKMARLLSGSACRSLHAGYSSWGDKSVEFSDPVENVHASMKEMRDLVLIVSREEKMISSSSGHEEMETHPYAKARYQQARDNFVKINECLSSGDWNQFRKITFAEAMSLHAMMLTGETPFILMRPNSLSVIEEFKNDKSVAMTLDAGANVHLIHRPADHDQVKQKVDRLQQKGIILDYISDQLLTEQKEDYIDYEC